MAEMEKSSMASPSSEPVTSASTQRIQNTPPGAMEKPLMLPLSAVRSPAALPFLAPVGAT